MDEQLLAKAVEILGIGMGTVFAFLLLLVVAISVSGKIIQTWLPPAIEPAASTDTNDDAEIAVVIAAADAWRRQNGG